MVDLTIDNDIQLTDAHYQLLARAVAIAEMGDDEEADDYAISDQSQFVSTTRDPLDRFDGATWREASGRSDFEVDGHRVIHWDSVQARKGDQRASLTVIDLGGLRLSYQT